ncbi:hypothetical protein [Sphingomonas sp. GC_Shp_3]|uniref:hypothetical protein n=1 Tax=Sphingomonas sp. GC_Shp_3 TaxID=2937383 RepID=UPI002269DDF4|nr:hypothetical protein [Sphingomonas sp. GC_Shp_3]
MAGTFGKRTTALATPHPGTHPRTAIAGTTPLSFEYRPKAASALLVTALTGAVAVFTVWTARDNDRGLIINHLIRLDPSQATIFWWGMAVVCGIGFLLGLFLLVLAVSPPRLVTLDATGITAPRNTFTTATVTLAYGAITDLRIVTVKRHRTLTIAHRDGRLSITETVMGEHFDTLIDALAERCSRRR